MGLKGKKKQPTSGCLSKSILNIVFGGAKVNYSWIRGRGFGGSWSLSPAKSEG
jgi:hypothetical protein